MSDTIRSCPKCGGPIPEEAPQGLCPKCVLQQAATGTDAGQTAQSKPVPPSLEELAAAFPQLQIVELVGQGGMGFVFKARQPKLDRFVAVKILPQTLALDPAFAERFQREARVLAKLNHPNIVTIFDFGQTGGFFFLLMEYVDGVNLREAMKLGRFTPTQALDIVPKICDALHFAHNEGILHRDIKPENILLDSRGRVKIADFGIAKILGTENVTETKAAAPEQQNVTGVVGTPNYMAPEQLTTPSKVDQRADIYSLGVVFYEMLTGELPGGSVVPPSQKSSVDARIDEIVLRTLEKERERRQKSADEVKTQVETIVEEPKIGGGRGFPQGNYDYRSQQTFAGLPLVHVTWGSDGKTVRTAKGIVAFGPRAIGVAAVGVEAYGVLAFGALALGLAPVGGVAVGGAAAGLIAIGLQSTGLIGAGRGATALFKLTPALTFLLLAICYFGIRILRTRLMKLLPAAQGGDVPPVVETPGEATSGWMVFAKIISAVLSFVASMVLVIVAVSFVLRGFAPSHEIAVPPRAPMPTAPVPPSSNARAITKRPQIHLLAVADYSGREPRLWQADGSAVSGATAALVTNGWRRSSPGVLWFSITVSNVADESVFDSWLVRMGGYTTTAPYSSGEMQILRSSGARLIQFSPFPIPKRPTATVEFAVPVKPWRKLLAWDGKTLKLTENHLPNSESINEIEIEPLKAQRLLNYDPFGGLKFTTNAGSRISMKLPINIEDQRRFVLDVTDTSGTEHRFWLGGFYEGGQVYWEINVQPSEIQRIELKDRLVTEDYFWKSFPDVELKPSAPPDTPFAATRKTKQSTGKLVISPAVYDHISHQSDELTWGFNCFVPAGQQATFVFVRWMNGVPHIEPALSAYYLVGDKGGIDVPFSSVSCFPVSSNAVDAEIKTLGTKRAKELAAGPVVVQWNVNLGLGFTTSTFLPMASYELATPKLNHQMESGYQCSVPLVSDSKTHTVAAELRVFLTPVTEPVLRTRPTEIDHTNYVAGRTLPWSDAEMLRMLDTVPKETAGSAVPPRAPVTQLAQRSLQAPSAAGGRELAQKTIMLVRPDTRVIDASNGVATVTVWTDATLQPDEHFNTIVQLPDGEMRTNKAALFVHWRQSRIGTSTSFTWFFGGALGPGVGVDETQQALTQLRSVASNSVSMVSGQPLRLFAVTNNAGASMVGYIQYVKVLPERRDGAEPPAATVNIRRFAAFLPSISYSAKVPRGYGLRATANLGEASTHSPARPYDYDSSWFRTPEMSANGRLVTPPRLTRNSILETQFQELQDEGRLNVSLGKPLRVFSVTNETGEVYEGFLELVGPEQ